MKDILTALAVFWTVVLVCANTAAFTGVPWSVAFAMSTTYCALGGIIGLLVGLGCAAYIAFRIPGRHRDGRLG